MFGAIVVEDWHDLFGVQMTRVGQDAGQKNIDEAVHFYFQSGVKVRQGVVQSGRRLEGHAGIETGAKDGGDLFAARKRGRLQAAAAQLEADPFALPTLHLLQESAEFARRLDKQSQARRRHILHDLMQNLDRRSRAQIGKVGRKACLQHIHPLAKPGAERADVRQIGLQAGEELLGRRPAACEGGENEGRAGAKRFFVVPFQLTQAGCGDDEAAKHPGIGFLTVVRVIADGQVDRQFRGRKQAGVIDDSGQQGTQTGEHGGFPKVVATSLIESTSGLDGERET